MLSLQNHNLSLISAAFLFLFLSNCISSSYKPSSIQDIIKSKLNILKGIRQKAINRQGDSSAMAVQGRDYGGGYGGGGGMQASYSSNYDTALTALAFLSFGVYLLNLLLMAMNRTAGRRKRDLDWNYEEGDVMSFQELMSVVFGDSVSTYLFGASSPECSEKYLCVIKDSIKNHNSVKTWVTHHKGYSTFLHENPFKHSRNDHSIHIYRLLNLISQFNIPAVNFINDLSDNKDCEASKTDCLFLHNLQDGLKRVKNKDNKLLSFAPDLLQSGKARKMKRNASENYNPTSIWGIIQFLYQVLTPT